VQFGETVGTHQTTKRINAPDFSNNYSVQDATACLLNSNRSRYNLLKHFSRLSDGDTISIKEIVEVWLTYTCLMKVPFRYSSKAILSSS
jgi:transposase